jgi:hypothetical protein
MAWLAAAFWLAVVWGASPAFAENSTAWRLPIHLTDTSSSMEAQMLGEKVTPLPRASIFSSGASDQDSTTIRLPYNLEMNISFRYNRDPSGLEPQRFSDSARLMKYSMDYRLFPNLQVGLNSYLYRPADDGLLSSRQLANRMGFGPEVKYNLGRWNFLLKSQMEAGTKDHSEGMQNWFRVWYAF